MNLETFKALNDEPRPVLCEAVCAILFFGSIFTDATMKWMPQVTKLSQLTALMLAAEILLMANCLTLQAAQDGQPAAWPQSASDLKPDPAILFGSLPNGLRYVIVKNATPAGQVALRLRIASGSLRESDAQQGIAHLLEHMAFRGSTHVPQGEMIKILQRKGLSFGPDTNALDGLYAGPS